MLASNGSYYGVAWGTRAQAWVDVNGDGKTDWCRSVGTGAGSGNDGIICVINLGSGGTEQTVYTNILASNGPYYDVAWGTRAQAWVDVNGDGQTDWCRSVGNGAGSGNDGIICVTNLGSGGTEQTVYTNMLASNGSYYGVGWGARAQAWVDVNGDGKTDWCRSVGNGAGSGNDGIICTAVPPGLTQDLLASITNGLGASTAVTYKPLTDSSVYTKDSTGVYPVMDIQVPMYVVSQVSSSTGVAGSPYISNYNYVGAKSHLTGGGFLGFRQTISTDAQTGIVSKTSYCQGYPYQGLPLTAEKRTAGGVLLNSVANTWTTAITMTGLNPCNIVQAAPPLGTSSPAAGWSAQYHAPQLTQSVESSYELNGGLISTVTTSNAYDAYGNPTSITVSTPDGYSKTTTNSYVNDTDKWYLGRLTNATVNSTSP